MGTGSVVLLTCLACGFIFYLIGIPAYRKGYGKGYFNGWNDNISGKKYDSTVRKDG